MREHFNFSRAEVDRLQIPPSDHKLVGLSMTKEGWGSGVFVLILMTKALKLGLKRDLFQRIITNDMEGLHHDTNLEPISRHQMINPRNRKRHNLNPYLEMLQYPHKKIILQKIALPPHQLIKVLHLKEIELYEQMVRIRRFEERSLRAYQQGHIGGFLHLYIGQEAVAVGSVSVLGEDDHVITAYRDHGHALAVGMNMDECMAELYGKKTGCSKGKGGSMHFFAPDKNFWGGHGIVGGQTPLGLGIAYAIKHYKKKGSCLCFMGDGRPIGAFL